MLKRTANVRVKMPPAIQKAFDLWTVIIKILNDDRSAVKLRLASESRILRWHMQPVHDMGIKMSLADRED